MPLIGVQFHPESILTLLGPLVARQLPRAGRARLSEHGGAEHTARRKGAAWRHGAGVPAGQVLGGPPVVVVDDDGGDEVEVVLLDDVVDEALQIVKIDGGARGHVRRATGRVLTEHRPVLRRSSSSSTWWSPPASAERR